MNNYELNYTLQQHTPLIHFHNQQGATLRATEVKPKLDRFLIARLKNAVSEFVIPGSKSALDYKLSISLDSPADIRLRKIHKEKELEKDYSKLFFANMGDDYDKKPNYLSELLPNKRIKLQFLCFNKDLLKQIDAAIAEFFIIHNFGCRQSKGFGSFTIIESKRLDDQNVLKTIFGEDCVACHKVKFNWASQIAAIHKDLKKSIIDCVAWEGKKESKDEKGLSKALLGLATAYKVNDQALNVADEKINRIPSPIRYKVIDKAIYVCFTGLPKDIFGHKLQFEENKSLRLPNTLDKEKLINKTKLG